MDKSDLETSLGSIREDAGEIVRIAEILADRVSSLAGADLKIDCDGIAHQHSRATKQTRFWLEAIHGALRRATDISGSAAPAPASGHEVAGAPGPKAEHESDEVVRRLQEVLARRSAEVDRLSRELSRLRARMALAVRKGDLDRVDNLAAQIETAETQRGPLALDEDGRTRQVSKFCQALVSLMVSTAAMFVVGAQLTPEERRIVAHCVGRHETALHSFKARIMHDGLDS